MNKKSVVAFRIQHIVDFDELTCHFLEVVYVHLCNTRGVPVRLNFFFILCRPLLRLQLQRVPLRTTATTAQ